jgi:uncharacterized membrane protein (UPF0127 family)
MHTLKGYGLVCFLGVALQIGTPCLALKQGRVNVHHRVIPRINGLSNNYGNDYTTTIRLQLPETPEEYQQGLAGKALLPSNTGMWFTFKPAKPVLFWMKACKQPLDLLFIKNNKIVGLLPNLPPCATVPCAIYSSLIPVDAALELPAGNSKQLGLSLGDTLSHLYQF